MTGARRHAGVAQAVAIVREEAERYQAWRRARTAAPAIAALRNELEVARRSVLDRHGGKLARLDADERRVVETITSQLVAKLLHAPTLAVAQEHR